MVLSQRAAERLGVKAGDELTAAFGRSVSGIPEYQRTRVKVKAVLPLEVFQRQALFARLDLLEAVEDYRDGLAVERFGWPGREAASAARSRVYPASASMRATWTRWRRCACISPAATRRSPPRPRPSPRCARSAAT